MKKLFFSLLFLAGTIAHAQSVCTAAAPCLSLPTASSVQVSLTWQASTTSGVTYAMYRSPAGGISYVQINASPITSLAYVDTTVSPNTTYQYIVEAVLNGVNSAPSNVATVTDPPVPSAPSNLTAH